MILGMVLVFIGVAMLSAPADPGPDGHPRLARRALRRRRRCARARQRAPEPAAHRLDRGCADDRARARDARRDARGSIVQTFTGAVNEIFVGDYAITAQNNFIPIPIDAAEAAAKAPGVVAVGNVRTGEALVFGKTDFATAVDPGAAKVINARLGRGLAATSSASSARTAPSSTRTTRRSTTSKVGSPVEITFANGNNERRSWSRASSTRRRAARRSASSRSRPRRGTRRTPTPKNLYSFVQMDGGETDANAGRARGGPEAVPEREGRRRARSSSTTRSRGSSSILNILYVLLALSVIVSLFGIVNTLVLSVFERTREIGMLRAIGMTRRQMRRMIRHESVITSLIGAVHRDRARASSSPAC